MTARRALQLFALVVALWALSDGAFALAGGALPLVAALGFEALAGLSLFVWYRHDATERAFERSAPLGVAIALLWVLAVPWYLWRSRSGAQKWRVLLGALGVAVLFWLAFLVANLPAAIRYGR
jgi:hypothetical protein